MIPKFLKQNTGLKILLLSVLLLIIGLAFACLTTENGIKGLYPSSVDWANHLLCAEILYQGKDLAHYPYNILIMDAFPAYPHGAYYLTAGLAHLLKVTPLQAMNIIDYWFIWIGGWLVALACFRSTRLFPITWSIPQALIFTLCTGGLVFFYNFMQLSLSGHIYPNSFFSQFVGTVLVLGGLLCLQFGMKHAKVWYVLLYIGVMSWVAANFHLIPAVWFATASSVWCFGYWLDRGNDFRKALMSSFAVLSALGLLIYLVPATKMVLKVASNTSGIGSIVGFRMYLDPSIWPMVLFIAFALLMFTIVSFALYKRLKKEALPTLIQYTCGFIAVVGLVIGTGFNEFIHHYSAYYPLYKWIYILSFECLSLLVLTFAFLIQWIFSSNPKPVNQWAGLCVIFFLCTCVVLQYPFYSSRRRYNDLIKIRQSLTSTQFTQINQTLDRLPIFGNLNTTENLYLLSSAYRARNSISSAQRVDRFIKYLQTPSLKSDFIPLRPSYYDNMPMTLWNGQPLDLQNIDFKSQQFKAIPLLRWLPAIHYFVAYGDRSELWLKLTPDFLGKLQKRGGQLIANLAFPAVVEEIQNEPTDLTLSVNQGPVIQVNAKPGGSQIIEVPIQTQQGNWLILNLESTNPKAYTMVKSLAYQAGD